MSSGPSGLPRRRSSNSSAGCRGNFDTNFGRTNRSIEADSRLWNVSTRRGETYSGRLDTETATSVELLDVTGRKHVVQRTDIAEMTASNRSIMPADFDRLPEAELAALLEYLASPPGEEKN